MEVTLIPKENMFEWRIQLTRVGAYQKVLMKLI